MPLENTLHLSIQQELDELMKTCDGDQCERDEVRKYLDLSYGRVLRNSLDAKNDEDQCFEDKNIFHSIVRDTITKDRKRQKVRHVIDWIVASVRNKEAWLKNVDDLGRPKKLLKFSTLEDIVKEADKAMLKASQKLRGVRIIDGDEQLEMELEDGCYVVRLLTPAALDRESGFMQHCIGQGGYDSRLEDDNYRYWSLRDPFGKPHVTIEARKEDHSDAMKAKQISGKQNAFPVEKYALMLGPFFARHKVDISLYEGRYGFNILGADGTFLDKRNLPTGFVTAGGLNIENNVGSNSAENDKIDVCFPTALHVRGDLTIHNCNLQNLPCDITIDGNMVVVGSDNIHIPKSITIRGNLSIIKSENVCIEDGVEIGGDFMLAGITSMKSLPAEMKIGGGLYLDSTPFENIPLGVEFLGALHVMDTPITNLPKDRISYESLSVRNTKITEFPAKLEIRREFSIECMKDTLIRGPREIVQTGDYIDVRYMAVKVDVVPLMPNLQLVDAEIEELPADFIIDGDISILDCQIKKMPNKLVADNIHLLGKFPAMPAEVTARKLLSLTCTPWEGLPEGTKYDVKCLHLEGINLPELHSDIEDETKVILFIEGSNSAETTARDLRTRIQQTGPIAA